MDFDGSRWHIGGGVIRCRSRLLIIVGGCGRAFGHDDGDAWLDLVEINIIICSNVVQIANKMGTYIIVTRFCLAYGGLLGEIG